MSGQYSRRPLAREVLAANPRSPKRDLAAPRATRDPAAGSAVVPISGRLRPATHLEPRRNQASTAPELVCRTGRSTSTVGRVKSVVRFLADVPEAVDAVAEMRWREWGHPPEPVDL